MEKLKEPKPRKKRARRRKVKKPSPQSQQQQPLPAPIEPANLQQPNPEPEPSLLGSLFSSSPEPSASASPISSTASYDAPLTAEEERLLAAVPDVIGSEPSEVGAAALDDLGGPAALSIPEGGICDPEQVRDVLQFVSENIAKWRECDAYRLDEKKAGKLAKPYAQVLNHLWARFAPELMNRLAVEVPGLTAAVVMTVLVFYPAFQVDMQQRKSKKGEARRMVEEIPPPPQPAAPVPASGMIYDEGRKQ